MSADKAPVDLAVSPARTDALQPVLNRLRGAEQVALTTHLNADGDGTGSEAAVAAWLEAQGKRCTIINPTPFPELFRFLLHRPGVVVDWGSAGAEEALREADLLLVLDTSERNRVEPLAPSIDPARTLVIDHHPAGPSVVGNEGVQDPSAAATGELIYDLISLADGPWPPESVLGIYVALVSDTGSFRFSNTTSRTHAIAADLLGRGVDPEAVFQRMYATAPRRRLDLLSEALSTLETDPEVGLSWMVVSDAVAERLGVTGEDFEGLVDHARSVERTEVAVLFRETNAGETKISLRSNGAADVNRIARQLGGGGHVKAAGALVPAPPAEVVPRALEIVRRELEGRG